MAQIFGVAGTNGAGKDLIAEILEKHGFYSATATAMLAKELKERGWPVDREHKAKLSTLWRKEGGMGALVDHGLALYESVKDQYQGFVVGSLRHPGEVDRVHELGGKVIWVDADPKIRYQRVISANRGGDKAAEDNVSFEEFMAQQEREMQHHSGDAATLNIAGAKEKADIFIMNNGDDKEAFEKEVVRQLGLSS